MAPQARFRRLVRNARRPGGNSGKKLALMVKNCPLVNGLNKAKSPRISIKKGGRKFPTSNILKLRTHGRGQWRRNASSIPALPVSFYDSRQGLLVFLLFLFFLLRLFLGRFGFRFDLPG